MIGRINIIWETRQRLNDFILFVDWGMRIMRLSSVNSQGRNYGGRQKQEVGVGDKGRREILCDVYLKVYRKEIRGSSSV